MAKKKTHLEFCNDVYNLVGNEYEVLGKYDGNKIKIEMVHNLCGHHFDTKPNVFLSGCRCPKCAGKLRKDTNYYKEEIFNLVGSDYIVLGEYVRCHDKIKMKHISCNHEFEMSSHHFLQGQRCPLCYGTPLKTDEQFKKEVFDLVGDEYVPVDKYITRNTKIKIKHNTCGNTYSVMPSDFIFGYRCPHCFGNIRKTQEQIENDVFELYKGEYKVLGEYKNMLTKIKMKHVSCGYEWDVKPSDFLSNKSHCPECSYSKGEEKIKIYLKDNNIKYIDQYKVDGLVGVRGGLLSYDYFLPDFNILLEYQGEFHDGNGNYFMKQNLDRQQEHDRRKKQYCLDNNIKLLEIWYWDFDNIEEILIKELQQSNLETEVAFIM